MLIENMDVAKSLVQMFFPEKFDANITQEQIAEIMHRDGERVSSAKNFRKAQVSQQAWKKHRFNYMAGINRYNRNGKPDIKKKIRDNLNSWGKIDRTSDSLDECSFPLNPKGYFDFYEFLSNITDLESDSLKVAATFTLSEQFVESSIFADKIIKDVSEFKNLAINKKPIPSNVMESLLLLVGYEDKNSEMSLWEQFCGSIADN